MTKISSRWTPDPVKRRDTLTGTYEELNQRMTSADMARLQQAFLVEDEVVKTKWADLFVWALIAVGAVMVVTLAVLSQL
jgi:hypothetical protein